MNSVPFLMGAAVVRQPPGSDGVVASIGRMPWLHDRRLTTLQLPDDTLPSNRAVALDWPVPYQAEWVGAPPRLLISRLVFQGRSVASTSRMDQRVTPRVTIADGTSSHATWRSGTMATRVSARSSSCRSRWR